MRGKSLALVVGLVLAFCNHGVAESIDGIANSIAPLIDPAKLATLGNRGANQRVRKYVIGSGWRV